MSKKEDSTALPERLLWLADAPLFIDSSQIERFYNAVARPSTKKGKTTVDVSKERALELAGALGVEGGISPGDFGGVLAPIMKALGVKLTAKGELKGGGQRKKAERTTIELIEVEDPMRQLVQLTLHYMTNHKDRLFLPSSPSEKPWRDAKTIAMVPRALVFLDLPGEATVPANGAKTRLIPTAAEFANGKIELIYNNLHGDNEAAVPKYPEPKVDVSAAALAESRKTYWKWFADNFSATLSMVSIEKAASDAGCRIQWIDYRLPITDQGETLHLHFTPSGHYDTGVFAYNLVKRGFKHGLRLVGTVKAEPDINVLAVFEK